MTGVIQIDWNVLTYIAIGLFALVGFFRGWWREGVTTVFLTLLVIMLTQPTLAELIVDTINKLIKLIAVLIQARSIETQALASAASAQAPVTLEATNRNIYIIGLIILAALSYLLGKIGLGKSVSPLGALLGGILGAFNGFIVISLVKEYLIGRLLPGVSEVTAAAAAPSTLSVQVQNIGGPGISTGALPWLVIVVGLVVLLLLISQRLSLAPGKMGLKAPAGYK
jgi:hypothetical protein